MSVTTMFERRVVPPYGLQGGAPGAPFRVTVDHADGRRTDLPGKANVRLVRGDAVVVESCGGGGYGAPEGTDSPVDSPGGSPGDSPVDSTGDSPVDFDRRFDRRSDRGFVCEFAREYARGFEGRSDRELGSGFMRAGGKR